MKCGDGFSRGFEISRAVAFGDGKGCPAVFVLLVPDLDFRSVVGEELHHFRIVLIRRAVHGGFAIGIDGIDIRAQFHEQLRGFEHFGFGSCDLIGFCTADSHDVSTYETISVLKPSG